MMSEKSMWNPHNFVNRMRSDLVAREQVACLSWVHWWLVLLKLNESEDVAHFYNPNFFLNRFNILPISELYIIDSDSIRELNRNKGQ